MPENIKNPHRLTRNLKTLLIVLGFFVLTLCATAVEISIKSHEGRPFLGNVVALALVNINVLLLAVLLLLLGRQLVKFYFERRQSPVGAGFRSRLVAAFIGLSIVPAGVLFVVAIGMLTGGVKFWFGPKVEGTVRYSLALVEGYKADREAQALKFADVIAKRLQYVPTSGTALKGFAENVRGEYGLDMVEIYNAQGRTLAVSEGRKPSLAHAEAGFIAAAVKDGSLTEVSQQGRLDVVRGAAVFRDGGGNGSGVVVASFALSPAISESVAAITGFYREYWDLRTFKNPLKESYILSFMLITFVVVFAALWFALYISKGITGPITTLADATRRISGGDYDFQIDIEARDEIGVLVDSFGRMTRDLKGSQERLKEANLSLRKSYDLLEERRRFIEMVLENVNAGVLTIDRAGKISTANRAAESILGLDAGTAIGKGYRDVFEFHQLTEIREEVRAMAESGPASMDKDIQITVNHRTLHLRLFITTLQDADGGYLGILVVFDDLTELIKAQRAAAWKEVARRIAHEVKNPLTPIQLSAQRLRKRYLDGTGDYESIIGECTETIIRQVEGMKSLVDEFSKFARMPEVSLAPTGLHEVIDEVAQLYSAAHKDVAILRDYDTAMPSLSLDREQMKRVFMNLLDNAVNAMDGRGRVTISTRHDRSAGVARVDVADEGVGILPEDREKLFQPYFSKKKQGTGLGLAIVDRIISDHHGHIRVEGNQPKGARFIIELPVRG